MKSRTGQIIVLAAITLVMFLLLTGSDQAMLTQAAPDAPQYTGYLSASSVSDDTYRITLYIQNLGGVTPPSSKWYDPQGVQVSVTCGTGNVVREYDYSSGSLYQVRDHFYIRGCNRKPGQYRVRVGLDINLTFTIKDSKKYVFLPVMLKPWPPVPPTAFAKLSPSDGGSGVPLNPVLDWGDSDGVGHYEFCYDTSNDNACTDWTSAGAASQASPSGLSADTTYYWQVRAVNKYGTTYAGGDSTAYWSFTTYSGTEVPSEMVLVPAGEFQMGCHPDHNGGLACYNWELPLHTVYLDAYRIEKNEVTNAQYAQCVASGACPAPADLSSYTRPAYYGNPDYNDYPVVNVTWQNAYDYCAWAGKRLPSEAEWEKAARGASVQTYPWGDAAPTCALANFSASFSNQCVGDTSPVGAYPAGASPYGALDMAGNVQEWVNDWYAADYYQNSPASNPPGPDSGTNRVVRGGSYGNMGQDIMAARRSYRSQSSTDALGFRCAAPPAP